MRLVRPTSFGISNWLLVGYNRLLPVLSDFLLQLLRVNELVARPLSGIKPLQQDVWFPRSLFHQCDSGVVNWLKGLGWNCLESCIPVSSIRTEYLNKIQVIGGG